jgi:hypothetical protein
MSPPRDTRDAARCGSVKHKNSTDIFRVRAKAAEHRLDLRTLLRAIEEPAYRPRGADVAARCARAVADLRPQVDGRAHTNS